MTEFVRPIQERIEDFLILDIEALCNHADHLKYHTPDSLSESELHATFDSIIEESAHLPILPILHLSRKTFTCGIGKIKTANNNLVEISGKICYSMLMK